ncbi:MAG TPA: rhombotarget lipoprotein [Burkholderiales bacterium]|nr:rhombotarget lipoprotein [Burkholderiales bacterium]
MRKIGKYLVVALVAIAASGCASMNKTTKQRQVASVLSYLYPGTEQAPPVSDKVAEIKVPFRIGVTFVPDDTNAEFRLPETDRIMLAGKVGEAFKRYPFVTEIVAVPSLYLEPGGGFPNLDRIAALLKLDVIALVSFDQVQNAGATGWSFLYWTGIGAYVVDGDQYDILTAVETTVFDIRSRRLLMRAGGISNLKGSATMVGFSERAPKDPSIKLILPPGYNPNAARKG